MTRIGIAERPAGYAAQIESERVANLVNYLMNEVGTGVLHQADHDVLAEFHEPFRDGPTYSPKQVTDLAAKLIAEAMPGQES